LCSLASLQLQQHNIQTHIPASSCLCNCPACTLVHALPHSIIETHALSSHPSSQPQSYRIYPTSNTLTHSHPQKLATHTHAATYTSHPASHPQPQLQQNTAAAAHPSHGSN
jgi:hypothetical protein